MRVGKPSPGFILNNFFSNGKLVYLARGFFEHYCVNRTGKNKRMDKLS
jgi:hypothetical protein